MSLKTKLIKIFLPIVILLAGAGVMAALILNRPAPKKEVKKETGALVSVFKVKKEDRQVIVKGTGTVKPEEEISVIPQVSGKIAYVSPSFVNGGFFKRGELLFKIEDIDYILALEQADAARAKAEYEMQNIESYARVARIEWERLKRKDETEPNPLVLYEPQLRQAKASLASAMAAVEQAKLDLERTRIRAPFNSIVRDESVDLGQYVTAGSRVAVLFGTDTAEIMVPLSLEELGWIDIPSVKNGKKGSLASVQVRIGGEIHKWEGKVTRSLGEVDTKTRMMQIIVAVDDPYGIKKGNDSRPELAVGSFVDVHIKGRLLRDVFSIPRTAFRENSTVWVMDETNKLRVKKVNPLRIEREEVLINEGLDDGDLIVMTTLSGAADGMKLRPLKEGENP